MQDVGKVWRMSEYITEFFGSSSGGSYTERREEIVRFRDCRKADRADKAGEIFFCKMFGATVEPWRFCSWGERKPDESLIEFIEREGRKRDTND